MSTEAHSSGKTVTNIARLDGNVDGSRLAQLLDVEQILREVLPGREPDITEATAGRVNIACGAKILAADDSGVARSLIEQSLTAMGLPFIMAKTGLEAWNTLEAVEKRAHASGLAVSDEIALALTDLEMPEMDGFTLTRKIKGNAALRSITVVIHSSLTGSANEEHVSKVGADAYISKFVVQELVTVLCETLGQGMAA